MVKDTPRKENISQKTSKDPNDTGRTTESNRLSAKTQLGGGKQTPQNQHLPKNSQKSSKAVEYSFIKSKNRSRKPKGPRDNQSIHVAFRDNTRIKPEKVSIASRLLLKGSFHLRIPVRREEPASTLE